ncbi:restriction endonuclease subunit S [Microbacterium sp.]|uniref:restriction endonuclease subunit S n=1 Tax=Microbacterium sp. TaxID=51671 RepID=UPI002D794F13|nr:restriction endonuclease subunit S [Microbacterium sp.]HET6301051.1 restriction endonuclease subunit S [Microbacterium sp.]
MSRDRWQRCRLGDVTLSFNSRRRPVKSVDRTAGPYPYYGASGVIDYVDDFLFEGLHLLVAEDGENLRSRNTPVAFLADGRFWVSNHAHVLRGNDCADTRYLAYALEQLDLSGYLTGSTQPKLTKAALDAIQLDLPPQHEQQAIAEVLGALDDKIAANTALASRCDELVRAEYLSVVGERTPVGKVAESPRSGVDPSGVDPQTPYVGLEHLDRREMWLARNGTADEVSSAKSRFEPGDVLFGKLRPYFHKVASAPGIGICSTDILVVRALDTRMATVLLAALSSDAVIEAVVAASEGTRMPRTSWKDLARVEITWPVAADAGRLAQRLDAIRDAAIAHLAENRTLAETRDALLPHLMSGQLRVRDAEKIAADAGA